MNIEKKKFLKSLGFGREVSIVTECKCPLCADRVNTEEFKNETFIKEFERSGCVRDVRKQFLDTG